MILEAVFWLSVVGVLYPYVGYPLVLLLLRTASSTRQPLAATALPPLTLIIPVHNEAARIQRKVLNTRALRYPADRLQILFVSDGSTDDTVRQIDAAASANMSVVELPQRAGKAAALNAGLVRAANDILVFSDASIELAPDSLEQIVRPFADPSVGCVSGEDRIAEAGGEGLYGRFELLLRRLESDIHSIVGASGSFYAQRRVLCQPFTPGLAPDFLSVLRTVEQGFRAISEPRAVGSMTSVRDPRQEFQRKVRTLIRGLTTLFAHPQLLNPFRYGMFSFLLFSHKVLRWTAPLFLVGALLSSLALASSPFYLAAFVIQAAFYGGALAAFIEVGRLHQRVFGKLALYFASVNAAVLVAWIHYAKGVRQELWTPSRR